MAPPWTSSTAGPKRTPYSSHSRITVGERHAAAHRTRDVGTQDVFLFRREIFQFSPGKIAAPVVPKADSFTHTAPCQFAGAWMPGGRAGLHERLLGGEALGEVGGGQPVVLESGVNSDSLRMRPRKSASPKRAQGGHFQCARFRPQSGADAVDHRVAWTIRAASISRPPRASARRTEPPAADEWHGRCAARVPPASRANGSTLK